MLSEKADRKLLDSLHNSTTYSSLPTVLSTLTL